MRRAPALVAFSMKLGILWQSVSTWMVKPTADALVLKLDHSVEKDLPVAIAGEIVVGDEEPVDALRLVARE